MPIDRASSIEATLSSFTWYRGTRSRLVNFCQRGTYNARSESSAAVKWQHDSAADLPNTSVILVREANRHRRAVNHKNACECPPTDDVPVVIPGQLEDATVFGDIEQLFNRARMRTRNQRDVRCFGVGLAVIVACSRVEQDEGSVPQLRQSQGSSRMVWERFQMLQ
jgi:hypothetical protein